ncbi:hypothetical protein G5714_021064 [Onychostoma macrolepis]|uniref:Uncharacterized protein n=1 Tax=Onychostoma macrolepis TaxID=369639 RepID=A0A7J6BW20_9TELE|nr:hypothetical protein G5714_021064 [Onychostoma macrolepis]
MDLETKIKALKRQQQKARRKSKKIILALQKKNENTSDSEHSSRELESDYSSDDSGNMLNVVEQHLIEDSQEQYDSESQRNTRTNMQDQVLWDEIDRLNDSMDVTSESDTELALALEKKLSEWAMKFNISLTSLTHLLKILREHDIDVPADGRTLLKTPRSGSLTITEKSGGKYTYFGIKEVSWIFDDNGTLKCRWTSSLSNIKNNSPPNPNWKVYDIVKIVGPSIGDYDQANQYISDYTTGVSAAEDSITYSMRDPAVVELPEKRKGKRSSVMKVTSIQRHLPVKQSGNEVKQSGLKTRNVPLPKPPIYHDALQRSAKKDEDDPKSSAFSEFHDLQQHHMTSKEIPEVQTRIPDDVHLKKSRNAMKRVGLKTKNVQLAKSPIYHVKSPLIQKVPRVKTSGDCLDDNTEIPDKSYFNSSQPNPVFLDTLQEMWQCMRMIIPKALLLQGRNQRKQNAKSPWRNCLI